MPERRLSETFMRDALASIDIGLPPRLIKV
jgi:hypothetical protein